MRELIFAAPMVAAAAVMTDRASVKQTVPFTGATYNVKLDDTELSLGGDQKTATGQVVQVEFDCAN